MSVVTAIHRNPFIKPAKFSLGWPLFAHFGRRKEQWEYLHRNRLPCQRQDTWMSHIHGISCAPRTNTLWKFNDTISSLTSSLSSMRSCVVISISITEEQQHHFRAMPGWSEEIVAARTNLWQYADDRPTNRDEEHNKNSLCHCWARATLLTYSSFPSCKQYPTGWLKYTRHTFSHTSPFLSWYSCECYKIICSTVIGNKIEAKRWRVLKRGLSAAGSTLLG